MSWLYTIVFTGFLFSSQGSQPVSSVPAVEEHLAVIETGVIQDETEKFDKTYPLNANGRVSISNVNGSIVVEAWDRKEVRVEYTKVASTKEHLADVDVRIDAQPERIDIDTDYDNWKTRDGRNWNTGKLTVDYHLIVPRTAFLNEVETVNGSVTVSNFTNFTKISAVNGAVKASNLRGAANLSTVNGEVAADFDRLETGSKIVLSTVNGKVNLVIPSDSSATITADSLNGSINNDFGLPVRKGKYVGRDLYGKLGGGDVRIKLDSVNGGLTIGRKNDGRSQSPAVNLLPQKEKDDEDWDTDNDNDNDNDNEKAVSVSIKADRDVERAVRASQKETAKAVKSAQKEIAKIQPQISQITSDSVVSAVAAVNAAVVAVNSKEVQEKIEEAMVRQREAMTRVASDAFFSSSLPRVKLKSGSFAVKGIPTVTIYAEPSSVKVTGWDKSEVAYRVVQYVEPRRSDSLKVTEEHTDSAVTITVDEPNANNGQRYYGDGVTTRVEVFVPRKSNLKITANGEIRVNGLDGKIELNGTDEAINVRDTKGVLRVANSDGRIRVIGFNGEVTAETSDGEIDLEGDFSKLSATGSDGSITLTLPENTSADLEANCPEIEGDGIELTRIRQGADKSLYRMGSGGAKFQIRTGGDIQIRGAGSIKEGN
jgi:hypothetical protein